VLRKTERKIDPVHPQPWNASFSSATSLVGLVVPLVVFYLIAQVHAIKPHAPL